MKKRALITGVTGQDGSYLSELLLEKDYEVHGIVRRSSSFNTKRIDHLVNTPGFKFSYGDLNDASSLNHILRLIKPDEIYSLGAQSHVRVSFDIPEYTCEVTALGTLRLLEAVRDADLHPRFLQASSSEMFGSSPPPQSETTVFHPRSPYACAKVFAFHIVQNYREAYGIHASNAISHNHTSPRRGETFVTKKVTRAAAAIKLGLQKILFLGNLDAKRDWGYAPDYVHAFYLMLQQDRPDDYVIATGETHSIRELLDVAFGHVGLDWEQYVKIEPRYFRPSEVSALCGNATKANRKLGWKPTKNFKQIIEEMVDADLTGLAPSPFSSSFVPNAKEEA